MVKKYLINTLQRISYFVTFKNPKIEKQIPHYISNYEKYSGGKKRKVNIRKRLKNSLLFKKRVIERYNAPILDDNEILNYKSYYKYFLFLIIWKICSNDKNYFSSNKIEFNSKTSNKSLMDSILYSNNLSRDMKRNLISSLLFKDLILKTKFKNYKYNSISDHFANLALSNIALLKNISYPESSYDKPNLSYFKNYSYENSICEFFRNKHYFSMKKKCFLQDSFFIINVLSAFSFNPVFIYFDNYKRNFFNFYFYLFQIFELIYYIHINYIAKKTLGFSKNHENFKITFPYYYIENFFNTFNTNAYFLSTINSKIMIFLSTYCLIERKDFFESVIKYSTRIGDLEIKKILINQILDLKNLSTQKIQNLFFNSTNFSKISKIILAELIYKELLFNSEISLNFQYVSAISCYFDSYLMKENNYSYIIYLVVNKILTKINDLQKQNNWQKYTEDIQLFNTGHKLNMSDLEKELLSSKLTNNTHFKLSLVLLNFKKKNLQIEKLFYFLLNIPLKFLLGSDYKEEAHYYKKIIKFYTLIERSYINKLEYLKISNYKEWSGNPFVTKYLKKISTPKITNCVQKNLAKRKIMSKKRPRYYGRNIRKNYITAFKKKYNPLKSNNTCLNNYIRYLIVKNVYRDEFPKLYIKNKSRGPNFFAMENFINYKNTYQEILKLKRNCRIKLYNKYFGKISTSNFEELVKMDTFNHINAEIEDRYIKYFMNHNKIFKSLNRFLEGKVDFLLQNEKKFKIKNNRFFSPDLNLSSKYMYYSIMDFFFKQRKNDIRELHVPFDLIISNENMMASILKKYERKRMKYLNTTFILNNILEKSKSNNNKIKNYIKTDLNKFLNPKRKYISKNTLKLFENDLFILNNLKDLRNINSSICTILLVNHENALSKILFKRLSNISFKVFLFNLFSILSNQIKDFSLFDFIISYLFYSIRKNLTLIQFFSKIESKFEVDEKDIFSNPFNKLFRKSKILNNKFLSIKKYKEKWFMNQRYRNLININSLKICLKRCIKRKFTKKLDQNTLEYLDSFFLYNRNSTMKIYLNNKNKKYLLLMMKKYFFLRKTNLKPKLITLIKIFNLNKKDIKILLS